MFETTHIRIERAAEMLGTDADTLLIAGTEGRIRLYSLLNKRIMSNELTKNGNTPDPEFSRARHYFYVPLTTMNVADILQYGHAKKVWRLSDEDENGDCWIACNGQEVVASRDFVFAKTVDIEAIQRTEKNREDEPKKQEESTSNKEDRSHWSLELKQLVFAADKYWMNADRHDPTTQPDNAQVAKYLEEKGMSETLSKKAASIVRPEWAHIGRKPK